MNLKKNLFVLFFSFAGAVLILFVILPLISTLLSTSPADFLSSFSDPEVLNSIVLTCIAAAIATFMAGLTGIPMAYLLARYKFPGKRLLEAIINLPIVIPHTAAGIALLLVFGRRGWFGQWLEPLGLTFTDNLLGVVIAMLFVSLPFLVNLSREAFTMVDEEFEKVAMIDGASHWQAFLQVTLPLAWRGVLGGAVMMWARGISEFGAVIILAYHPKVVPVLVYERFLGYGLDAAQPVALILIMVALFVFITLQLTLLPKNQQ